MNKTLSNKTGVAAIVVILAIVVIVVGGGTVVLGVRAAVTGEEFFAPFKNSEEESEYEYTTYDIVVNSDVVSNYTSDLLDSFGLGSLFNADGLADIINGVYVQVEIKADENDIVSIAAEVVYSDALQTAYDDAIASEDIEEDVTFEEYKEDLYDEYVPEDLDDTIINGYITALETLGIEGYSDEDVYDLYDYDIDVDVDTVYMLVYIPTEVNDALEDLVEANIAETLDSIEEYLEGLELEANLVIDLDNYLEDTLYLACATLGDTITVYKNGEVATFDYIGFEFEDLFTAIVNQAIDSVLDGLFNVTADDEKEEVEDTEETEELEEDEEEEVETSSLFNLLISD